MAVHREEGLVAAASLADHTPNQLAELRRQAVARGVRDVDDVGAGGDHLLDRFDEVLRVGATRVLRRVLDVVAQRARVGDHLRAAFQHLFARHSELAVDVHVRDREHDVDLRGLRIFDGAPYRVDVLAHGSRQRGDGGAANLARNLAARVEIARGGNRKARFDDVDAKPLELPSDLQLGVGIQVEPRRLLAVAQRGVEDEYAIYV